MDNVQQQRLSDPVFHAGGVEALPLGLRERMESGELSPDEAEALARALRQAWEPDPRLVNEDVVPSSKGTLR